MGEATDDYSIFPKSKYQSDGWEPFLPPNPLADSPFEHLALEFQIRKRKLDRVRTNQALDGTVEGQKPSLPQTSGSGLALNLPNNRTGKADRLKLVDEDLHEYTTLPGYQPSAEQIKRFLYVEARRLSCAFPGWDFAGVSFSSVKSEKKKVARSAEDSLKAEEIEEDEEEAYRQALQKFHDLHRLPKIVEAIVNLSGSGAANLITDFRSDAHAQALKIFKAGLCRTLGISKSDVSIVGVKNTTVGKLAESVEIDFQIFTYREDLCEELSESIRNSVSNGNLASELNNIGLTVYVTLRAGPILFQYPNENDFTQSLFGAAAAELLRNRIMKFKSTAIGTKTQLPVQQNRIPNTSDSPEFLNVIGDDDNDAGNEMNEVESIPYEQDSSESSHSQLHSLKALKKERRSHSSTAVGRTDMTSTSFSQGQTKKLHGFNLYKRPATVCSMSKIEQSPDVQLHLSRCRKRQIDAMDRWSLEIPIESQGDDNHDPSAEPQTASDAHVAKLTTYFAKSSTMRKTPSNGFQTAKVADARKAWDLEMSNLREQVKRGKEDEELRLSKSKSLAESIHRHHVENNQRTRRPVLAESTPTHQRRTVKDAVPEESLFGASGTRAKHSEEPRLALPKSHVVAGTSLPSFSTKSPSSSKQSTKIVPMQNAYDLLIDEDEHDHGKHHVFGRGHLTGATHHDANVEGGSSKNRRDRRSHGTALAGNQEDTPLRPHKFAQVVPLDMQRAERLGLAILAQSHVDHVLKDDRLLNAVDYSKEAVARNLKAEKQFQPIARRIERKVQLIYRRGGVLTCMVCRDKRKIPISSAIPALIDMLNPKGIEGLEELDCPYCLGLNPKYAFEPISYNRVITDETWEAAKHAPPLGPNQLILQLPVADSNGQMYPMNALESVWISPTFGYFLAVSAQGSIVEAEVSTGKIIRRFNTKRMQVTCTCATKSKLFLGARNAILEIDILTGVRERSLSGMQGLIISLSTSSDGKMLAAGSTNCTTFIWDLTTGKICRHIVDCSFSLPDQIKHLSDSFAPSSQTFTFRHHAGPVSCCSMRRDAVITGSWDGTICVASLSSYREKWTEEHVVMMLERKSKTLTREAKSVAVDLAERSQDRKKSVRIFRQHAENLESLKNTLETIKSTLASKRLRLQQMNCRKFLCCSETAGRVTCISMHYMKKMGYLLFAGYSDGKIRHWDIKSESIVRVFVTGKSHNATCMCFGGERMFTAGESGAIKVWNLSYLAQNPAKAIHKNEFDIIGHNHGVVSMKVCGNILLSAAEDNTIRVWNLLACEFEVSAPDPNTKESEVSGDVTAREAPLTARSARSSISGISSLSSFMTGNTQADFAGKVINISIYDEPVDFKVDDDEGFTVEVVGDDINIDPDMVDNVPSDLDSDPAEDLIETSGVSDAITTIEPLSESVYIDLLEMSNSLPALNTALKESIETANKWSRRLVSTKQEGNKSFKTRGSS